MKKNLKAFMGKALAGTMLVTSTFAGTVIASESVSNNVAALAEADTTTSGDSVDDNTSGGSTTDPSTSGGSVDDNTSGGSVDDGDEDAVVNHTYSFANVPADTVIPTGKDAATNGYYMVESQGTIDAWKAVPATSKADAATGDVGAYVVSATDGNYVRIADYSTVSPMLRFDASAESVSRAATGKVTYTAKIAWEATGSSMSVFNLVSGDSTVLTVGTGNGKTTADQGTLNGEDISATNSPNKNKLYARTGTNTFTGNASASDITTNTFYEIKVVVDKATKTATVYQDGTVIAENVALDSTSVDEVSIQGSGNTNRCLWVKDVSAVSENASSGDVETGATFTKVISDTLTIAATNGTLDITGSDVESFDASTNALVLKSTTKLDANSIVNKINEGTDVVASKQADGSIKLTQGDKTPITFTVTVKQAETPDTPDDSTAVLKSETTAVGDAKLDDLKAGDQIDVVYKLDKVLSINNFTFYVDYNPAVLTLDGAQAVEDKDAVTYQLSGVGTMQLIPVDLITKQQAVVPAVGDTDYDNALGGKADGVKTAAQLGRLKLAGVAGLNGDSSSTAVTDTSGILFKLRFTVKGAGSTSVGINSVGGAKENEIFYATPKSEEGSESIGIGDTIETPEVIVPETTALVYSYDKNGVVISAKDGKLTVSGDAVKSYADGVITLNSDATVTVDALLADIKATAAEGITVTVDGSKVTISDGTNSIAFTVVKAAAEPEPTPTGDVTVKVGSDELKLAVGTTGLTATTTAKGKVKEVAGGVYVPVTRGVELSKLTAADFAVEGATVKAYDAAVADLTVTIDGKDYVVGLYEVGDVDLNASTNVNDALNIVKYVNGEVQYTDKQKLTGDVDANESTNVNDALSIVKYVNGEVTEFGAEK